MILLETRSEKMILPSLCREGTHRFLPPGNTTVAICGAFRSSDVAAEAFVVCSPAPKNYSPKDGDVCADCFQIKGQEPGARDLDQATAYDVLIRTQTSRR